MQSKTEKSTIYYVGIFSIIFLLSAIAMYFVYAQEAEGALCLKTCQKRLAEQANKDKVFQFWKEKVFISITLSDTCERSQNCPTYKDLADWYDNTNRYLSGDFAIDENGIWHREKPIYPNVFELYRNGNLNLVTFVDPDDYTKSRTKNIFIEHSLPVYLQPESNTATPFYENTTSKKCLEYKGFRCMEYETSPFEEIITKCTEWNDDGTCKNFEQIINTNGTRSTGFTIPQYTGMHIEKCRTATIGWKEVGEQGLLDVINHFYDRCAEKIEYEYEQKVFFANTIFTDCGKWCQHLQWLSGAKEQSKELLLK